MLKKKKRVPKEPLKFAVVCARGLGDALLSMILAHNLKLAGKEVVTFSSILCELKEWFPQQQILSYPTSEHFHSTFSTFDTIVAADHSLLKETHHFGNKLIILKESGFDKKCTMVENLQNACTQKLSLAFSLKENGIVPLKNLQFRLHSKRVVLHTMSADLKKNWPPQKFISLGRQLEKEGYQIYFCVSPAEITIWEKLVPAAQLPLFPSVTDLAKFVYESGYLIGNDSGVGHLASLFNIPTLSLFARKSYSHLWRPGWGPGAVITPPPLVFGSKMKQKYWKALLSVKRVKKAFNRLTREI
jgi:heptosyltransferase III